VFKSSSSSARAGICCSLRRYILSYAKVNRDGHLVVKLEWAPEATCQATGRIHQRYEFSVVGHSAAGALLPWKGQDIVAAQTSPLEVAFIAVLQA
jgi:hypothetical protein